MRRAACLVPLFLVVGCSKGPEIEAAGQPSEVKKAQQSMNDPRASTAAPQPGAGADLGGKVSGG